MNLSQESRLELRNFIANNGSKATLNFVAEYLAERICSTEASNDPIVNRDYLIREFTEELTEQVNERT